MNLNNIVSRPSPLIFSYFLPCLQYSHGSIFSFGDLAAWEPMGLSSKRLLGDAIVVLSPLPLPQVPSLSFLPISLRKGIGSGTQWRSAQRTCISPKYSSGLHLEIGHSPWRAGVIGTQTVVLKV